MTVRARLLLVLLIAALFAPLAQCAAPTALDVLVYSEVPCAVHALAAIAGGGSVQELAGHPPGGTSAVCVADVAPSNALGHVVVTPAASRDGTVAFAVMQRPDGAPADECLDPAKSNGCIVAKRQLRYQPHQSVPIRIDLRLSCLNVACAADQTCVQGACRSSLVATAQCASGVCGEDALGDGPLLASLSLTAGALSPGFAPSVLGYSAAVSLSGALPPETRVTATVADAGATLSVQGAPAQSGVPTAPIAIGTGTNPVDINVTSADGRRTTHYALIITGVSGIAYMKASNARTDSQFGAQTNWTSGSASLSGDTLVVGAPWESSGASGVNANQADVSSAGAGAAYVFRRAGGAWSQQAYLKASNARAGAHFGGAVALSVDTLAVGSPTESSGAMGVGGNQADTSAGLAGAVYVLARDNGVWTQKAYLKPSANSFNGELFGCSLALSGDTLVVGACGDPSPTRGVNGIQSGTSAGGSGAAYVFVRGSLGWTQQAYLKASNTDVGANFGHCVSIDGETIVVGAWGESSAATGVNGNQADVSAPAAGAAYVFVRNGAVWTQQAYLKASNARASASFGTACVVARDTLVVSARADSSAATGIDGDGADASATGAGAAYVFERSGGVWSQQAYLKASAPGVNKFGSAVALSNDTVVVGAMGESSSATGINGNQSGASMPDAGAAYLFVRHQSKWTQAAYLKATNTRPSSFFGSSVALEAGTIVVGAYGESSAATGINGNQSDVSAPNAGAAYVY